MGLLRLEATCRAAATPTLAGCVGFAAGARCRLRARSEAAGRGPTKRRHEGLARRHEGEFDPSVGRGLDFERGPRARFRAWAAGWIRGGRPARVVGLQPSCQARRFAPTEGANDRARPPAGRSDRSSLQPWHEGWSEPSSLARRLERTFAPTGPPVARPCRARTPRPLTARLARNLTSNR
eukprot:CAMPEP_0172203492 /NCGR_PEP_ID=MMETSP1050-20130122/31321_1 /TAXON_ID=233186 /ORGANISM="Cryptomonas curvata, Strain CCAP979/52" /LENGTH=179 /DNA_ID=CAMNT_0012881727 /DNA_START=31 /DNA_END=566 /DNA_ORIENTATION=-